MSTSISKTPKVPKEVTTKSLMESDIESLMIKLDNEKRDSEYLDELSRNLESQLQNLKNKRKTDSPSKNPLQNKIFLLEKQIEYETAQYDALRSENSDIRKEINQLRLENSACKKSLSSFQAKIQASSTKAVKTNEMNRVGLSIMNTNQTKISAIRSKSVLHKIEYGERIREMSLVISQKSQVSIGSRNNAFRLEQLLSNFKGCNIYKVQTELNQRWENFVGLKKTEIENYKKYITQILNGFEQIKLALGMSKVDDIVNSFIRSEEQSSALYKYLSVLNGQIDEVEETLRENMKKIQEMKAFQVDESKQLEKIEKNKGKVREIAEMIEENQSLAEKIGWSVELAIEKFQKLIKRIGKFKPDILELLVSTPSTPKEFQDFLTVIDKNFDNLTTPNRKSQSLNALGKNFEGSMPPSFLTMLEQKDLYIDNEIEDFKIPLEKTDFTAKAEKILGNLPNLTN